jgi:hypothetical protein
MRPDRNNFMQRYTTANNSKKSLTIPSKSKTLFKKRSQSSLVDAKMYLDSLQDKR